MFLHEAKALAILNGFRQTFFQHIVTRVTRQQKRIETCMR